MEIKETQDMWVLRKKSRLRIPDVKTVAAKYAATIEQQIVEAGLKIAGPYIFISHNLPKDSKTFFDWEICRPVTKSVKYEGKLELAHLEPIKVASRQSPRAPSERYLRRGMVPLSPNWICPGISTQGKAGRYITVGAARALHTTT